MAERYTTTGAHFTMATESTYGTAGGSASSGVPLVSGGDGLVEARDVTERRGVLGRGPLSFQVRRERSEGTLEIDMEYNIMSRLFEIMLGAVETDALSSPQNGMYENYYYQTDELASITLVIYRGSVAWTYNGVMCNGWTITYDGDQEDLKLSLDLAGLNPTKASWSGSPSLSGFKPVKSTHLATATYHGTSVLNKVKSFEITGENSLDTGRWVAGQAARAKPLVRGLRSVSGRITMEWDDEMYLVSGPSGFLRDWETGASGTLNFVFNNGDTSPATDEREMSIYCPGIVIDGEPITVEDQGVITSTATFKALNADVSGGTLSAIGAGSNEAREDQLVMMSLSGIENGASL